MERPLRQELVLTRDDARTAEDYLQNLLGPWGPDVARRSDERRGRGIIGMLSGPTAERTGRAVPLGDQFRRARESVAAFAESATVFLLAARAQEPELLRVAGVDVDATLSRLRGLDARMAEALVIGAKPREIVARVLGELDAADGELGRIGAAFVLGERRGRTDPSPSGGDGA
jgi:hypothetical protein